jgi:hypothetical protein
VRVLSLAGMVALVADDRRQLGEPASFRDEAKLAQVRTHGMD